MLTELVCVVYSVLTIVVCFSPGETALKLGACALFCVECPFLLVIFVGF